MTGRGGTGLGVLVGGTWFFSEIEPAVVFISGEQRQARIWWGTLESKGWCSGENTCPPTVWPRFKSWKVVSMPYVGLRGSPPGPLVFPFLHDHKLTFPNSNFTRNGGRAMRTCHPSLVKFIYFMYLKKGADFSNCDRKKIKQKQLLVWHLPLGCDLWAILVAVGCVWIPSAINP